MNLMEQIADETFVNIKVKTLNHSIYEVIANPHRPIRLLTQQIQHKTGVPVDAQRMLYRGNLLDLQLTLADYHIQEGSIIQLIANKLPSEVSAPSIRRPQPRENNYNKQHSKLRRHRFLQQRSNGFRIKREQSLQTLHQNKHILDQLMDCLNFNFLQDVAPFKMERRRLQVGEWLDVRDGSGQWVEGQVINQYGDYVLIHYNGWDKRWDEWISAGSDRLMPFRTFTVHPQPCEFMSPYPRYERPLAGRTNPKFQPHIENFVNQLSLTLDNLNRILKDLQFQRKQSEVQQSLHGISQIGGTGEQTGEQQRKQQFQTPNKQVHVGDNLSNKCQDDISNKCDNDDISNKSFKSKRSEGLVDTSSMKSLIIQESRKRQNKVFFDNTEQAQSVRSVKNKHTNRNYNAFNQEYILEEDSQYGDQEIEDPGISRKKQLKRKMKASQLAPLLDRMGRLLMDLAPHMALLGHTDQSNGPFNQNLSTYTNEGSLQSKISALARQQQGERLPEETKEEERLVNAFCSFQVPIMLTPMEIIKVNRLLENQRRNNIQNL